MKKWIIIIILFIIILMGLYFTLHKKTFYDFDIKDSSIFSFKGEEVEVWARVYNKENPPDLIVYINHCEYREDPIVIKDDKQINRVFNALSKIKLTGIKNNISSTGTTITYSFKDGKDNISFSFQDNKIPTQEGQYYIKGYEGLNKIYNEIYNEKRGEKNYE